VNDETKNFEALMLQLRYYTNTCLVDWWKPQRHYAR